MEKRDLVELMGFFFQYIPFRRPNISEHLPNDLLMLGTQEPKGSGRRPQAGEVNKCDSVIANW